MCRWRYGNIFKRDKCIHETETSYDLGAPSRSSRYWHEGNYQGVATCTDIVDDNLMANAFTYYKSELQVCLMCTDCYD